MKGAGLIVLGVILGAGLSRPSEGGVVNLWYTTHFHFVQNGASINPFPQQPIGDIDGDGNLEFVGLDQFGQGEVIDVLTGAVKGQFRVDLPGPGWTANTISVEYYEGATGLPEIIVTLNNPQQTSGTPDGIAVYRWDGSASAPGGVPSPRSGSQAFPNPFAQATELEFVQPAPGESMVEVYDAAGRRVRSIRLGPAGAGSQKVSWNGANDEGQRLPPGEYVYRVMMGGKTIQGSKAVLIR